MRKLKRENSHRKVESVSPSDIGRSKEIVQWAIDYIEDTLPDYVGNDTYGADLGNLITEGPNNNGTYEDDSWGFISKHINDARDEYEYEKNNFGEVLHNPFEKPEAFVVCMLINTVNDVLSQVPFVEEHWDGEFEITEEVVKEILDFLK